MTVDSEICQGYVDHCFYTLYFLLRYKAIWDTITFVTLSNTDLKMVLLGKSPETEVLQKRIIKHAAELINTAIENL